VTFDEDYKTMSITRLEPLSLWEDMRGAEEHYGELCQQFEDVWVAVVDRQVIAASPSLAEAKQDAAKASGKVERDIPVLFIMGGGVIYG